MIEWRICSSYPDYEISEYGDLRRIGKSHARWKAGRIKIKCAQPNGYLYYKMPGNKSEMAHRLVAFAFLGPRPSLAHEVAHNDGSRTMNHYSNLRWATRKENMADTEVHGTTAKWERNGHARLTRNDVKEIRQICATGSLSQHALAKIYGVSQAHISGIVHGRFWRGLGRELGVEHAEG